MARGLTRSGTKRWNAAEAERALGAWRASGKSMRAFAERRRLKPQRLGWWKKRLKEWRAGGGTAPTDLVPAVLTVPETQTGMPQISLRLGEGVVVEVADTRAVPPEWLLALVRGLREQK